MTNDIEAGIKLDPLSSAISGIKDHLSKISRHGDYEHSLEAELEMLLGMREAQSVGIEMIPGTPVDLVDEAQ